METMVVEKVVVGNSMGLHARPAAQLVHVAGRFKAKLSIRKCDSPSAAPADCRSVLSLLMLAASCGTELEVVASGEDAVEAVAAIAECFSRNFDEN